MARKRNPRFGEDRDFDSNGRRTRQFGHNDTERLTQWRNRPGSDEYYAGQYGPRREDQWAERGRRPQQQPGYNPYIVGMDPGYSGYGGGYAGSGEYGGEGGFGGINRGYGGMGRGYGDMNRGYGAFGGDFESGYGYSGYGEGGRERRFRSGYGAAGYRGRTPGDERGFWDRATDEVQSWFGDEDAEGRRRADQYRGRGPKGYTRSDERIKEDVSDRLTDDWSLDASEVEVEVHSCEVTLAGEVSSRNDKRRAEDLAESVSGVRHVQNNLRVRHAGIEGEARTTLP